MKLLVDELPEFTYDCPFTTYCEGSSMPSIE